MLFEIPAFKNARPSRPDRRVRPKHSGPELAVSIEVPLGATSVEAVAASALRRRDFGCYTGMHALRGGTTSIGEQGTGDCSQKPAQQKLEPEWMLEWA